MNTGEIWINELRARFGENLTVITPQSGRFPLTGKQAMFVLHGETDLFFSGKTPEGTPGFSLPLFPRMNAGTLIPPMPDEKQLDFYGRCLPDTKLIPVPWQDICARITAGDPFLWNALLVFSAAAKWQKLPENPDELNQYLTEWCTAAGRKLQYVKDQTKELIRSNTADQKRQDRHIINAFTSLFHSGTENAAVCSPDDPVAAAAVLTAAKNDIPRFTFAKGNSLKQRIERSIDGNQVRITPAVLEGKWYRESFLPMLVLSRDETNAYCVFRNRHNDPVAWSGATGELYVVNERFCTEINSVGWSFVQSFPEGAVTPKNLISFFFQAFRKNLPGLLFLLLIATVMDMFLPVINSMIFSEVIPNSDRTLLGQLFFLLLIASLAKVLLDAMINASLLGVMETAERSMQMALFDRVLRLPVDFFRKFSPGEMASRVLGFLALFAQFNSSLILTLLESCFIIVPIAMLFYYSAKLAAITLGILLILVAIVTACSFFIAKFHCELLTRQGELDGLLERFLSNIGKLHAAGAEKHVLLVWIKKFSEKQGLTLRLHHILIIVRIILSSLNWIIFCAVMGMLLWMYKDGQTDEAVSQGDFSGFISTMSILSGTLLAMLTNLNSVLQFSPFCKWLGPVLTAPTEEAGTPGCEEDEDAEDQLLQGGIELDKVSFSYDSDRQILKNVSLKAAPGEFIAITGESGAGKSTLLRLMLRFEKPSSGTVLYDGEDVSTKNMNRIRSRIGVVLQNAGLMPDSILHNIIGTTSCYTEEDAWEAAEMAGCAEDIRSFPMQMHTVLTGSTVSGGQQQRILLAHAMLRHPKLIFLDEATRALDNSTQRMVMESLRKIQATKVVIAHRLSTIMDADRIYVLEHGSVAEVGTYAELMKKQGVFAKMAARQLIDQKGE